MGEEGGGDSRRFGEEGSAETSGVSSEVEDLIRLVLGFAVEPELGLVGGLFADSSGAVLLVLNLEIGWRWGGRLRGGLKELLRLVST